MWHPEWYPPDFLKWAVPPELFAGAVFPPHCSGGGYLLGRHAAARILEAHGRGALPPFRLEDAYLGVLAQAGRLAPTNLEERMQDLPRQGNQTRAMFDGQILVHRVARPELAFGWLLGTGTRARGRRAG